MKKIILSFMFSVAALITVHSQSILIEKGQNGVGLYGAYRKNSNTSGFTSSLVGSFSGIVDVGVSLGRFKLDQKEIGEDITSTSIAPHLNLLIFKQGEKSPVLFGINGSFHRQFYNSTLRGKKQELKGYALAFGASLHRMIEISQKIKIQPGITFNHAKGRISRDRIGHPIGRYTVTHETKATLFTLELPFIFHITKTDLLVLTPAISLEKTNPTYALSLGFFIHN